MIRFITIIISLLVLNLLLAACGSKYPDAKSPEASMKAFQLDDRFEVQLFAAEPVVKDPVTMIFDQKGEVYVVEMPDYPFKPEEGPGKGLIKKLIDTDGDGVMDDFVVFADQVTDATSILPWKDGLLITAAPHIWFMRDTTGDGKADERDIVFSGFFQDNQEAQITNLTYNVDNWIYATNHGQKGEVRFEWDSDKPPLDVSGADFRFRLDTGEFERETAPGQFGQAFDLYGHRFVTQNTIHIQQMVIPRRYLERHPYLPSMSAMTNISDHDLRMFQLTEAPYWRKVRSERRQKQYDEQGLDRIEHVDNHFTGASGGTFYDGHLFPEDFRSSLFTGEVAGNLVHRDVLIYDEDQLVFRAARAEAERDKEFLASTDMWFRPDNFTVGPDGALYILDYYRQHIETPLSIPEDLKKEMDFMEGEDRGRIYRVVPKGTPPLSLEEVKNAEFPQDYISWLSHPNKWFRIQAQRMIVESADRSVLPEVEKLAAGHPDGPVRVQALYVMDALGGLTVSHIARALEDPEPGVREHALQLAEKTRGLLPQISMLRNDPSKRVKLQVVLSLGNFNTTDAIPAIAEILRKYPGDSWIRMAVLSSDIGSSIDFLEYLDLETDFFRAWDKGREQFVRDFTYITAARGSQEDILTLTGEFGRLPDESMPGIWKAFADGIKRSGKELSVETKEALSKSISPDIREIMQDYL